MMIGKVVCVSKPHIWSVTPGKIYDLYYNKLQYKNNDIYILDDKGVEFAFVNGDFELYSEYFITLEEWRELKLNDLGLDQSRLYEI